MKYLNQIRWWLHATWIAPMMAVIMGITAHVSVGVEVNRIIAVVWVMFGSVCVAWWYWVMGAIRHIIRTFDRVEHQLTQVSHQLTDIKSELGSIREDNY